MLRRRCIAKCFTAVFLAPRACGRSASTSTNQDNTVEADIRAPVKQEPVAAARPLPHRPVSLRRLAVVRPDLVDEWVPELNDVDVSSVPCNSPLPVWWRCSRCGANYEAAVRDRAVAEKGCPHCCSAAHRINQPAHESGAAVDGEKGNEGNAELKKRPARPSLADTHPEIARRWDTTRNGLLRPCDVTSESTLSVHWRSAEHRQDASFLRPVCAFVAAPYSPEEQLEARAAVEMDVLRQVRAAAQVEVARAAGTFPAEDVPLDDHVMLPGAAAAAAAAASPQEGKASTKNTDSGGAFNCGREGGGEGVLTGDVDIARAVEQWESNFDSAQSSTVFAATPIMDTSSVTRAAALNAYGRFVDAQRSRSRSRSSSRQEERRSDSEAGEGEEKKKEDEITSVVLDPTWTARFALRAEDLCGDSIAPSARLLFADADGKARDAEETHTHFTKPASAREEEVKTRRRRLDSLPAPPEEYTGEVHTTFPTKPSYPRRPLLRTALDSADGAGKDEELPTHNKQSRRQQQHNTSPRVVPVEASFAVLGLASTTQSLSQEYGGTSDANIPFDACEKDLHLQTLLGETAVKAMADDEVRALQYGRAAPRPRRTGKFRLRMPADAYGAPPMRRELDTAFGTASRSTVAGETNKGAVIEAPGTPRKVARPKKRRDGDAEKKEQEL